VTTPILLRITRLIVGRRASGFVLVAKGRRFPSSAPRPKRSSGVWLDSKAIVDGASQSLLASKIAFRRLDRDVPQEESNLIQFAGSCQ
jgi:hypothetical protein